MVGSNTSVRFLDGSGGGNDSGPISNYIALEIRKLYARQEELRQIVAVLEERVGTFRLHLRELLDGRE